MRTAPSAVNDRGGGLGVAASSRASPPAERRHTWPTLARRQRSVVVVADGELDARAGPVPRSPRRPRVGRRPRCPRPPPPRCRCSGRPRARRSAARASRTSAAVAGPPPMAIMRTLRRVGGVEAVVTQHQRHLGGDAAEGGDAVALDHLEGVAGRPPAHDEARAPAAQGLGELGHVAEVGERGRRQPPPAAAPPPAAVDVADGVELAPR